MSILTMSEVSSLFMNDNNLIVPRVLIKKVGLHSAILLSSILQKVKLDTEFVSILAKDIENDCGLSPYQQNNALQNLLENKLIETKIMGIPSTKHYRICYSNLMEVLA